MDRQRNPEVSGYTGHLSWPSISFLLGKVIVSGINHTVSIINVSGYTKNTKPISILSLADMVFFSLEDMESYDVTSNPGNLREMIWVGFFPPPRMPVANEGIGWDPRA